MTHHVLSVDEYRELLASAPGNAFDADSDAPDLRKLFTPASHRLALDPDVTVVRGARGTGKTVWFKVLYDGRLRDVASASYQMPRLRTVLAASCFGTSLAPASYPGPKVIASLLDAGADPSDLWVAVVLVALGVPEILRAPNWQEKVLWAKRNPEAYERALWEKDQEASDQRQLRLLLFDGLEHLHGDRGQADALVSGLLKVALELRLRTKAVRAKVFIRPDMYASASRNFPDASKLGANAADLIWSTENLYGLLFHQIGNAGGEAASGFRGATGRWRQETDDRFVAPMDVIADKHRQEEIFVTIAGPYMGADHRKGYTYTWLPNHLQDGNQQVSPRSFLRAVLRAAEVSRDGFAGHTHPLHHDAIRRGVQAASQVRVEEITEDIPWAAEAAGLLRRQQVPIEKSVVVSRWEEGDLTGRLRRLHDTTNAGSGPQRPEDYLGLIDQLVELGVMSWRTTGKIDLPDVYRIAFDIGRKGGVPRRSV